jgi:hypothetical protein
MAEGRPQRKTQPPRNLDAFDVGSTVRKKHFPPRAEKQGEDQLFNEDSSYTTETSHLESQKNDLSLSNSESSKNEQTRSSESGLSDDENPFLSKEKNEEISYKDLVLQMISNQPHSASLTSFSQKEPLLSFVVQKLSLNEDNLQAKEIKDFQQEISKFLSSFRRVYRQKKKRTDLILEDKWSKRKLRISDQLFKARGDEGLSSECDKILEVSQNSENDFGEESTNCQDSRPSELNPSLETDNPETSQIKLTRLELCSQMNKNSIRFSDKENQLIYLRDFILSKLPYTADELEDFVPDLDESIQQFLYKVEPMYQKSCRTYSRLISKLTPNSYLSKEFRLPESFLDFHKTTSYFREASTIKPAGRKTLPFSEKSKRSQQYASAEVRRSHEPGAIILATAQQPTDLGRLVRKSNSVRGVTVKKALNAITKTTENQLVKKTPSQALAFLLCNNFSKEQYNQMKSACTSSNANIWPNYNKVLQAKKECRPDGINIQSLCAQVSLQNLLDHTAKRILLNDPDMVNKLQDLSTQNNGELELLLYFKYGLDGCGSFNSFMQKDETGKVPDGTTILASQLVPLQVVSSVQKEIIVFNAKNANSARACRPIRIAFERETKDSIQTESLRLKEEIKKLETLVLLEDPRVTVSYKGLFTMIDGKVLNELTKNPASSSCPLCHQTSRQMSNPEGEFTPKPGTLEYGASILHFGLRSFEAIVKIGYRQDVKKSHERLTEVEKKIISDREKEVKAQFKEKLGLIVDQRRDGGAGNTTTGNVARIALENADVTAKICKVPVQLVRNLRTIWGALASGFALDGQKFAQLCEETEKLYFDKDFGVGWYNIPPTLHKILRHGKEIIENCALPIGMTNEEASEANNKILRHVRLFHARKTSWNDHLSDLYHRAMDVSDPVIADLSSTMKKKNHEREKKALSTDILSLLQSPLLPAGHMDNVSTKDSDEESDKYSDED